MSASVDKAPAGSRITVVGNVNLDVLMSDVADLPEPGTERIVPPIALRTGGSAANTAITLARLGRSTVLAGLLGDDDTAHLLRRQLDIPGLHTRLARMPGTHTGVTVAVESPGRDRAFLSSLGAMADLDADAVPEDVLPAAFVLLSGYFLLPGIQGAPARTLLDRARAAGARTALDTGWDPGGWPPETRADVLALLRHVDVFLPNDDEIRTLTGHSSVEAAAREVADTTGAIVVVKCGARGALLARPGQPVTAHAAVNVQVRDSTGAGDAFNAGLLHRLADGAEPEAAVEYASSVAATVISKPSHDRTFTPDEVLQGATAS
ncbi:carbohydrate kinase family protein [Spirillospora sp. NPDC052269]